MYLGNHLRYFHLLSTCTTMPAIWNEIFCFLACLFFLDILSCSIISFLDKSLRSSLIGANLLPHDWRDSCSSEDISNRREERHAINRVDLLNVWNTLADRLTSPSTLHFRRKAGRVLDIADSSCQRSKNSYKTSTSGIFRKCELTRVLH